MKSDRQRLSSDEIREIAALARISMSEKEVEIMRSQMSDILENIDVLNAVDTSNVEPTGHSVNVKSVMREDEPKASMLTDEVILNAPNSEDGFIRVRSVLD
tara:strand:- start:1619 stop:1921 length:303 start_codon:yes stop_codon:yes gene_type:complete